ncbi:hypothetical protein EUX98_g1604 [Antrodiella citrinella]|uniref:Mob1/phocein n=1 Tax=Antrodiella citrinella TaxID=2447956 RepID=A0A4S4N119_9APHY|nr:hypothetical protein EUX98_g1604 [Antrodiella citrinella]
MVQRPLKGSRISSFYPIKTLPSLASLDSAFQLQEYISLLIRLDVHDVETIVSLPGKSLHDRQVSDEDKENNKDADKEPKNEVVVDEHCWVYEQLRRLAQDLSHPLITSLQQECTRATCSEMKAAEWLYLCVAHGNDGAMEQCCAIDYILHTLDSATALLNSPRAFPSRLTIPEVSRRHFPSLARRLGRIFAHAYFHHREIFEQAEAESALYARFLALTSKFGLVPSEFLVIPPRLSSMQDNDEGNERLLDVREVEEPRRSILGSDSQRSAGDRWGLLSDTGSVIDLAIADDNEPIENQPDSTKKRWRSDTMVDRDTYLMGRKRREESLEKVFTDGTNEARPSADEHDASFEAGTSSPPLILDIAAPAPAEPHIPIADFAPHSEDSKQPATTVPAPQEEEEELMKPPMVVPSQARFIPEPETADPILEEPSIIPVPVLAPTSLVDVEEKAEVVDSPPDPVLLPTPATEEVIPEASIEEEEATPSTDITASEEEDEAVLISPTEEDVEEQVESSPEEPRVSAPADEVPEKEEDVTEAKEEEDTVKEIAAEPTPPAAEAPGTSTVAVEEDDEKEKEKKENVLEEPAQEVAAVADSTEPSEPSAAEL